MQQQQSIQAYTSFAFTQQQPEYFPYTFDEHSLIKTIKDIQELIFMCQTFEARLIHKHKLHISKIEAILFENSKDIPDEIYYKLMNAVIEP